MNANKYVLEVDDLSVEFHTPSGVVHAVTHSSFKLREGEILGIVGESGSGKSVTANAHDAPFARHGQDNRHDKIKGPATYPR